MKRKRVHTGENRLSKEQKEKRVKAVLSALMPSIREGREIVFTADTFDAAKSKRVCKEMFFAGSSVSGIVTTVECVDTGKYYVHTIGKHESRDNFLIFKNQITNVGNLHE